MIHDEIVGYDVAKLAKEKGFPQHIGNDAYIEENEYDDEYEVGCCYPIQFIPDYLPTITAPTQSLLQRWLREARGIYIDIYVDWEDSIDYNMVRYSWRVATIYRVGKNDIGGYYKNESEVYFDTYEDALEDALKYALENLV